MATFHLCRHRPHLPEEVIEAILIRLPVKSIIRFQCVSKSWSLLIKSSSFIHKHLITRGESFLATCFLVRHSQQVDERLLAVCPYEYDLHKETSTRRFNEGVNGLINLCDSQNQAALHTLPMPNFELQSSVSVLNLVGDCNGLMCFTYYTTILLVNPSLKQVKMLTLCKLPEYCKFVGFGFDSMTMDFKVIRILNLESWGKVVQQRAEVYNLKSNAWRKVDEFPLVVDYSSECSTFSNGVVHWCVGSKLFGWRILTFNMATELFEQMEFPQDWDKRESFGWEENVPSLFILNKESLAFVSCCHPLSSSRFVNVWTMSKHEKEETWTKLYSIGPLTEFLKPISFSKKNEFLYKTTTGKLILYDLLNHHSSIVCDDLSQLRPYDAQWLQLRLEIGECRSSLVSINT